MKLCNSDLVTGTFWKFDWKATGEFPWQQTLVGRVAEECSVGCLGNGGAGVRV